MTSRNKKSSDLRAPQALFSWFSTQRAQAKDAYTFLDPFPIDHDEWARFFDEVCGSPDLCEFAMDRHAANDAWNKRLEELRIKHGGNSNDAAWSIFYRSQRVLLALPMDTKTHNPEGRRTYLCLSTILPTLYPQYNIGAFTRFGLSLDYPTPFHTIDALRSNGVRLAHDSMSPAAREKLYSIQAWYRQCVLRAAEARAAYEFIEAAHFSCAQSTRALFMALPGLRSFYQMLGAEPELLDQAERSWRGKDVFFHERMPSMWRTTWSNTIRPTLLKMAAATRTSTYETMEDLLKRTEFSHFEA